MRFAWSAVGFGAILALLVGCGGGDKRVPVYPVNGSVQAKGQGAPHVRITFVAQDRQDGPATETEVLTDLSGKFSMTTYKPGDGLPPGKYAVFLIWPDVVTDDPATGGDKLRGRYNNHQKPAFTIEVKAETNHLPAFDVK